MCILRDVPPSSDQLVSEGRVEIRAYAVEGMRDLEPEFWDGGHLWIRLVERAGIVVISFHRG